MSRLKLSNSFLYRTGERIIPGAVAETVLSEHYSRYIFSTEFCQGKKVLNVASGCGYGSEVLLRTSAEVYNVDIDEELIAYGNNRYGSYKNHFFQMDAQDMQLPDRMFDTIVSFETFEHLPDHKRFIMECRRVLKDDGAIVLSMPNKVISSPGLEKPSNKFHFKEWEYDELMEELKDAFDVRGVYGQHFVTPTVTPSAGLRQILWNVIFFCYDLVPAVLLKYLKKYYLGYREVPVDEVKVEETHRIKQAKKENFYLDNSGRAYAVIILILSKKQ